MRLERAGYIDSYLDEVVCVDLVEGVHHEAGEGRGLQGLRFALKPIKSKKGFSSQI